MLAELTRAPRICNESLVKSRRGSLMPVVTQGSRQRDKLEEGNRRLFDIRVNFVFEIFRLNYVRYALLFSPTHPLVWA